MAPGRPTGEDVLARETGNDTIHGNDGDDLVAGGPGNDTLDGGMRADTAFVPGARSDFSVERLSATSFPLTDKRAGSPEGTDTLMIVEFVKFSGSTFSTNVLLAPPPPGSGTATLSIAAQPGGSNAEGTETPTTRTFVVTRTGDTAGTSKVNWVATGVAPNGAGGDDFVGKLYPAGVVEFAPLDTSRLIPVEIAPDFEAGESRQLITVPVSGDTKVEAAETFAVALSGASIGASTIGGPGIGTILDDDVTAVISIREDNRDLSIGQVKLLVYQDVGSTWQFVGASPIETVAKAGINEYGIPVGPDTVVALWYPPGSLTTVSWDPAGTTMNNSGWSGNPITAEDLANLYMGTIPDLQATPSFDDSGWDANPRTYSIALYSDDASEAADFAGGAFPSGTVSFAPGETSRTATATGTIQNDGAPPVSTASIAPLAAERAEGSGGTVAPNAVDFAGGKLPGGTLTFAPGETALDITLPVAADGKVELNERFAVLLSAPAAPPRWAVPRPPP